MKSEPIRAPEVREQLRALGAQPLEGSNHPRFEIWIDEDGHPHTLPYHKPGNRRSFEKHIALTVLRDIQNHEE